MLGLPTSREKCTGCGVCVNICPQKAISLTDGKCFFEYPRINQDLCVDCTLCTKVCPSNKVIESRCPSNAFAAISRDENDRDSSATGGASSVLVKTILEQNGIVYGCEEIDYKRIFHTRIDNIQELYRIKGSKYVQSFVGDSYSLVKKDLNQGRLVLFTGTPCQIAGLKLFLRKDYPNLYLVEIICFGIAPSQFLINHVDYICKKHSIENTNLQVYFRQKGKTTADLKYGTFLFRNGELVKSFYSPDDGYHFGFRHGYFLRENCFNCRYAKHERCSDVTIGDFWGLGSDSIMNQYRNVSVLLSNTEKGRKLIDEAKSKFIIEERPLSEAFKNPHFNGAAQKPKQWMGLRKDFEKYGYEYVFNKYIKPAINRYKCKKFEQKLFNRIVRVKNRLNQLLRINY